VSDELLRSCRDIAASLGVADRCEFVRAAASRLDAVGSSTVGAVPRPTVESGEGTTREATAYLAAARSGDGPTRATGS
jgi:hypothetical protein